MATNNSNQSDHYDLLLNLVRSSGLFDESFYRSQPHEVPCEADAIEHYFRHGAFQGKSPHPLFDGHFYFAQCPELFQTGLNPLVHYLQIGANEGKNPCPLFDSKYYEKHYNSERDVYSNPLSHYVFEGTRHKLNPCPLFDANYYLQTYPDVKESGMTPLAHFIHIGASKKYNPGPDFNTAYYLQQYPEVQAVGLNPLWHYLEYGQPEGRWPRNVFIDEIAKELDDGYECLRQLEPLLPERAQLETLRTGRSITNSRLGNVYFKLAAAIDQPFKILVMAPGFFDIKKAEILTKEYSCEDTLVLYDTTGGEKQQSVKQLNFNDFAAALSLAEKAKIFVKLIVQASPVVVINAGSAVCSKALENYEKQLLACSKFTTFSMQMGED